MSQVFHSDILNLLSMADMWRSRKPPTPLDFDAIKEGNFVLHTQENGNDVHNTANGSHAVEMSGSLKTESLLNGGVSHASAASGSGLKDQRVLSLKDNLDLFVSRYETKSV